MKKKGGDNRKREKKRKYYILIYLSSDFYKLATLNAMFVTFPLCFNKKKVFDNNDSRHQKNIRKTCIRKIPSCG